MKDCIEMVKDAIENDIPIFILKGNDKLAIETLFEYKHKAEEAGCSSDFLEDLDNIISIFASYRNIHPSKIKKPD